MIIPMYGCLVCDLIFAAARYDEDEMSRIYSDYHGVRVDNREKFTPDIRKMGDIDLMTFNRKSSFHELLKKVDCKKSKLLDWGGNGSYVPDSEFDNIYAYDVGNESSAVGVVKLKDFESINAQAPYDLITLTHVLEHLPYPQTTLQTIRGFCSEETILYCEVPYQISDPLYSSPNIQNFNGYEYCEHINYFNIKSITSILINCGFTPFFIDDEHQDWGPHFAMHAIRVFAKRTTIQ